MDKVQGIMRRCPAAESERFKKDMDVLVKRIATIALLVAFFLPLSQCNVPVPSGNNAKEVKAKVIYAYSAYKWPSEGSFMTFIAFFWPLAFAFKGIGKPKVIINGIELLLCTGTGFMLFGLTYFGSMLIGAYVAIASVTVYFLATLHQMKMKLSSHG